MHTTTRTTPTHTTEHTPATIPVNTPWGWPDHVEEIAPGIVIFATPSHGGVWLSPHRRSVMPPGIREIRTFADSETPRFTGFYEEDLDWVLVALSFPSAFSGQEIRTALEIASSWAPRSNRWPSNLLEMVPRRVHELAAQGGVSK